MSTIEALPDEILVHILGFISFKELCRFRQITRRMWTLSQDKDFWKKIKIPSTVVPGHLMQDIIRFDVKYLSMPYCTIKPYWLGGFLEGRNSNLIHLNVAGCNGNDELLADLVSSSKSLKSLDLSESRFNLVSMVIEKIPMENSLTAIDFSMMGNLMIANDQDKLDFKSIKIVVDKCRNLTDLILYDTHLSFKSIAYICNNLTNKMLRLDFCKERVMDIDIMALANQCKNLEYLNLSDTWVTYSIVPTIVLTWSGALLDLSLPQTIGLDLGLDEDEPDETILEDFKKMIVSVTNLKYLHIGNWRGDMAEITGNTFVKDKKHIKKLEKLFPGLTINLSPFSDDSPAKTNPSYLFLNIDNSYTE